LTASSTAASATSSPWPSRRRARCGPGATAPTTTSATLPPAAWSLCPSRWATRTTSA